MSLPMKEIHAALKNYSGNTVLSVPVNEESCTAIRAKYKEAVRNGTLKTFLRDQFCANTSGTKSQVSSGHLKMEFRDVLTGNFCCFEKEVSGAVTVGRLSDSDILIPRGYATVSRAHALVCVVEETARHDKFVMVIDIWSIFGTGIVGSDGEKRTSETKREVLLFPLQAPTLLRLGIEEGCVPFDIYVNCRTCLVCYANPRVVRFNTCGHLVVCHDCAQSLRGRRDPCPLCRAPLAHTDFRTNHLHLDGGETQC